LRGREELRDHIVRLRHDEDCNEGGAS
jgi:hypothetical protein